MAKRKTRRAVTYWPCCDCRECMADLDAPFSYFGLSFNTEAAAREDLKRYLPDHPSAFVAREVTEAIDPLPQRKPKSRKAA